MLKSMISKFQFQWLLLLVVPLFIVFIYNSGQWDAFVHLIVKTQLQLHKLLNQQVMLIAQQPEVYGLGLIGISFIYGVFHALGPGHGKAVIVSYLASNPQSKLSSCLLAFSAALFQAITAIFLVTSFSLILDYKYAQLTVIASQFSLLGYSLLLGLGLFIAVRSIRQLYKPLPKKSHGSCCGSSDVKTKGKSVYQLFLIAAAIGLRPCSGALIILVTSSMLGIYTYGVLGTLAMSLGTGFCTCLIALASLYTRELLNKTLALYTKNKQSIRYGLYFQLAGAVLIICLAWSLINANTVLTNPIL